LNIHLDTFIFYPRSKKKFRGGNSREYFLERLFAQKDAKKKDILEEMSEKYFVTCKCNKVDICFIVTMDSKESLEECNNNEHYPNFSRESLQRLITEKQDTMQNIQDVKFRMYQNWQREKQHNNGETYVPHRRKR
jgi:hypothetical protein